VWWSVTTTLEPFSSGPGNPFYSAAAIVDSKQQVFRLQYSLKSPRANSISFDVSSGYNGNNMKSLIAKNSEADEDTGDPVHIVMTV
jgi:hypothetical protein